MSNCWDGYRTALQYSLHQLLQLSCQKGEGKGRLRIIINEVEQSSINHRVCGTYYILHAYLLVVKLSVISPYSKSEVELGFHSCAYDCLPPYSLPPLKSPSLSSMHGRIGMMRELTLTEGR